MESCKPTPKALISCMRLMLGQKYTKEGDAEVAPMADPENYQYDIDVSEVAELWRRGSVVGSWLLDLTADVLRSDREQTSSMGEYQTLVKVVGLFTVLWISVFQPPVITTALFSRFESRRLGKFANKVLNGHETMFGGHDVR